MKFIKLNVNMAALIKNVKNSLTTYKDYEWFPEYTNL